MKFIQKYFYVITGIVSFIIYTFTIAPSVIEIDTGELATVQITLGIAHPTGYPLYTMIGYLFSLIPLPFTKIFQLNLLAAIYCSLSVSVFTYSSKLILDNLIYFKLVKRAKEKGKKKKQNEKQTQSVNTETLLDDFTKIISVLSGGLFLAISKTFWFQSTSVEVYSLHLLLITLIVLFLIKAFIFAKNDKQIDKHWLLFSIALALGFSNHMTTILILPGVAFLYFYQNRFNIKSIKQIGFMLLFFFPILILFYAYLPFRASQNPLMNWGNPIDLERIIRHISGHQYQVWLFSSTEAAAKQFNYFWNNIFSEFHFALFIALAGFLISLIKYRKFFLFNLIVFTSTVLYSINYDINDIDSYFLLAYISIGFFIVFGVAEIILFARKNKLSPALPIILMILFAGIQIYSTYDTVNQKENYTYENYTKALLNSVPKNSIVFSYQWDYFISASYYFQNVENFRKDVTVIDKELLRRSWYYNQLKTNHPWLLKGVQTEAGQFLEALKPFERDEKEKINANLLEVLYKKIMTGLISTNIEKHDYFIAPELVDGEMRRGEFYLPNGYTIVPHLFLFKVVNTNEYVDAPLPDFKIDLSNSSDKYITALKGFLSSMLIRRAMYELQFEKTDRAKIYVKKVAEDFPDVSLPHQLSNLVLN